MEYINYKTKHINNRQVHRQWVVVDAASETLGRLASRVAFLIRGKHKPYFSPHVNCGDHVVVLNADKVSLSGNKWTKKEYVTYSGYPSGIKKLTPIAMQVRHPKRIIEHAVRGMLPKNRLGRQLFHNLHVCIGEVHPYAAQQPRTVTLT